MTIEIDDPCQFGFKANVQTSDNLFILQSLVNRQKFKSKPLYVCFVDFTIMHVIMSTDMPYIIN